MRIFCVLKFLVGASLEYNLVDRRAKVLGHKQSEFRVLWGCFRGYRLGATARGVSGWGRSPLILEVLRCHLYIIRVMSNRVLCIVCLSGWDKEVRFSFLSKLGSSSVNSRVLHARGDRFEVLRYTVRRIIGLMNTHMLEGTGIMSCVMNPQLYIISSCLNVNRDLVEGGPKSPKFLS